jgi:hypothetical protein
MRYDRTRVHSPKRGQKPRYKHRILAEEKLGRTLERREIVHHRDGDKLNNTPENLMVMPSQSEHARLEHWQRRYGGLNVLLGDVPEFAEVKE